MIKHTIAKYQGRGTDCRVFFRRPDETIYAVLGRVKLQQLKRSGQLNSFLKVQRDSGVVIRIGKA